MPSADEFKEIEETEVEYWNETTFKNDSYRIITLEEQKSTVGSDNNRTNCISAQHRWIQRNWRNWSWILVINSLSRNNLVLQVLNQPETAQPDSFENKSQGEENDETISINRVTNCGAEERTTRLFRPYQHFALVQNTPDY